MDTSRARRKRYCCFYCNTYFYQVDTWQRHNRKHTGVEIECDDCGQMCNDHLDLRTHQNTCQAFQIYAEDVYAQQTEENSISKQTSVPENIVETPDSTSKQESLPDSDTNLNDDEAEQNRMSSTNSGIPQQENQGYNGSPETDQDIATNQELDHLIGEDKERTGEDGEKEEEDPETEAMIGIDQEEVTEMNKNNEKTPKSSVSSDTQIVINVESALNADQQTQNESLVKVERQPDSVSLLHERSSPSNPAGVLAQPVNLENSDLNKKYQPYFCKNCGARFTRKDSVTRHLKKGTCSGKSAIVCNICGKVFGEMFDLQEHFKREHKNVVFTPVVHRSILPRGDNRDSQPAYAHFPAHYAFHDQHHARRPYHVPDQGYRQLPPGIQTMFYRNQNSFGPRPVHPPPTHYHDQMNQQRPMELNFSPGNRYISKDFNFAKHNGRNDEIGRKREHTEYHEDKSRKIGKLEDYENSQNSHHLSQKYKMEKPNENINLSEYTNNAMSSKQYYNRHFIKKEPSAGKDEPPRAHQCKVCKLEFPRFEYLLTHLRKHKEKNEVEQFDDDAKETETLAKSHQETHTMIPNNDSNSISSDDNNHENQPNPNYTISSLPDKTSVHHANIDPVPVVIQQPHHRYNTPERLTTQHEATYPPHSRSSEPVVETLTPGVDGKFRPFICENCGQRFTRKDSLVRHAKKQTCYEEAAELKCPQCDKTFRYHKCLVQHQELVHGVMIPKQPTDDEQSGSDSEKNDMSARYANHQDSLKYQHNLKREPYMFQDSRHNFQDYPMKYQDEVQPSHDQRRYHMESRMEHDEKPHDRYLQRSPIPPTHNPQHVSPMPKILPPKPDDKLKLPPDGKGGKDYIGYCMLPRPFQCEYCGDRFAHRHSLKRHVRRHLGIGIPCHECGKLYRDQSEWRRHQRSIHNRHFEKFEVPRRMTYRDGIDQGLIGVVSNSEFENHLGPDDLSESENDDDMSLMKQDSMAAHQQQNEEHETQRKSPSNESNYRPIENSNFDKPHQNGDHSEHPNGSPTSSASSSFSSRLASFGFHKAKSGLSEENVSINSKDEKVKPFDFKAHIAGDKDSRKSVLDSYLCSPSSDDNDDKNNNNSVEKEQSVQL